MLRRLRVVELHPQVELVVHKLVRLERPVGVEDDRHALRVLVQLVDVDLGAELDDVAEGDVLLSVPHEERLGDEAGVLVEDLRLEQPVEAGALVSSRFEIAARFEVIRIRVVDLFIVLVEDLELEEVDALLEQVHIAEVLHMQHKLCACPVHAYRLVF